MFVFFPLCSFYFDIQVERKRHIGNDIVNIIFIDGDSCDFSPNCIKSQFTRILFYTKKIDSALPFFSTKIEASHLFFIKKILLF